MQYNEAYRLSQYDDLGSLSDRKEIRLKRHRIHGQICVEKKVAADLEYIYRFLQHNSSPYIPSIYECLPEGGNLILVEEYVQGRTLEDMLTESVFEEEKAIQILLDLCSALKMLHNAKPAIVCRDLKAENIMLDRSGNIKIVDFNIARTYQDGKARDTKLLGTAEYAAPEQYGFFQTDNRTDIYALGVLFNYMLLKKFPVEQMAEGIAGQIVRKCICLNPDERYQTVEELENEIRKLYRQEDFEGTIEETGKRKYLPPGFRTKRPWKMAVAIIGYALLTYFCFTMKFEDKTGVLTGTKLRLQQGMVWVAHLIFVAFLCNYCGIRKHFLILENKKTIIKGLLFVATYIVLIFIAAVITAIIEEILF